MKEGSSEIIAQLQRQNEVQEGDLKDLRERLRSEEFMRNKSERLSVGEEGVDEVDSSRMQGPSSASFVGSLQCGGC